MTDSWIHQRSLSFEDFKKVAAQSQPNTSSYIWDKLYQVSPDLFPLNRSDMADGGIHEKDWRIPVYVPEKNVIAYYTWDEAGRQRLQYESKLTHAFHKASHYYSLAVQDVYLDATEQGTLVVNTFPREKFPLANIMFYNASLSDRLKLAYSMGRALGEFHSIARQAMKDILTPNTTWHKELYFKAEDIETLSAFTQEKKSVDVYRLKRFLKFFEEAQKLPIEKTYVHGDFRLYNMVTNTEGSEIQGVFDFEGIHLNSPYIDIARATEFFSPEEAQEFFKAYQTFTGMEVNPKLLILYTTANHLDDAFYALKGDLSDSLLMGYDSINEFVDLKPFESAFGLGSHITRPISNQSAQRKLTL